MPGRQDAATNISTGYYDVLVGSAVNVWNQAYRGAGWVFRAGIRNYLITAA